MSAGLDSVLAGRDLPFQFDKSWNLLFSIILSFKMIIFDKCIIYNHFIYRFLSIAIILFIVIYQIEALKWYIYWNQSGDLSFFIKNDRIQSRIVLSQTVIKLYRSQTRSCYINVYYCIVSALVGLKIIIIAYPYLTCILHLLFSLFGGIWCMNKNLIIAGT